VRWANFLHIYQPPTQTEEITRRVADECYRKVVDILLCHPRARVTLNINACLTEQLDRYGLHDVIDGLKALAERGQIEFTGSAMYHPILPLIPAHEVRRQIELNTEVNRRYFGDLYAPRGFFPPEMCYSFEVAQVVAAAGFHWVIGDEIAYDGRLGHCRSDRTYGVEGLPGLYFFFKERPVSAGLTYGRFPTADSLLDYLADRRQRREYLLTGTDGEIYGHHRPGQERLLEDIYGGDLLPTCTVSELLQLFPEVETVSPLPSSWSTWEDEMAAGAPYSHWRYPGNELHELQWELTDLVVGAFAASPEENVAGSARAALDQGLHSCQYWWASCRPWWDTGMIERGAGLLLEAASVLAPETLSRAEALHHRIVTTARRWQESGHARRLREEYLREHPQVDARQLTFSS
jgi:alpha-amylase/alpha-mannosidase (GH57 family)